VDIQGIEAHLLRLVNIETVATAPSYIKDDAATALNQAFQEIWSSPDSDYFTREEKTLSTVAGTKAYVLAEAIQDILGPIRFTATGKPIAPCESKGELHAFGPIFQSGESYDVSHGEPQVYYLDRTRSPSDEDEVLVVTLLLAPTPDKAYTITYDAALECPSFTRSDFCDTPLAKLPIPHKYVETILLPIARYNMTRSHFFSNQDLMKALEGDYLKAMRQIGYVDPQIYSADTQPPQKGERSHAASTQ
jgi:hypothetical protein